MEYIILLFAGLFEAAWAYTLKISEGMTRLIPAGLTVVFMALSVWLLSQAMKGMPLSIAYPIWTGIGAIGAALFGVLVLGEPATALKFASIFLILGGIFGLSLSGAH